MSAGRVIPGYTHDVKTAISVPDDVYRAAERLARRRRVSRSALYTEALRRLLADAGGDDDITERLDKVHVDVDNTLDPVLAAGQADALRETW